MANTNKKNKNKPGFFSVIITLVFIAASIFGAYKVLTYVESDPMPYEETQSTEKSEQTDVPETKPSASGENTAIVEEIGRLNPDISADVLAYGAENFTAEALTAVLNAIKDETYTDETWYSATGFSVYAIKDLASGAVAKGEVRDMGSNGTDSFSLAFAGDVCFDESIPNMQKYAETSELSDCISQDLLTVMNEADIMFVNNEFTFTEETEAQNKKYNFKSPAKNVALYEEMGVDAVSLANNHSFDFGEKSFTDTVKTLTEAGISYTGAGMNSEEAKKPAYFLVNGRKIAYIAVCDTVYAKSTAATASSSGVFSLRNMDALLSAIGEADSNSDYVVVYAHWGHENSNWFSSDPAVSDQSGWGRKMVDAGADAVIGSHPHVLQGMEYHDGKIIAYSLGNFWFNGKTMDTGLLRINISNDGEMTCVFEPCVQTEGTVSLITDEAKKAELFTFLETHSGGFVSIDSDGIITAVRDTKGM